LQRKSNAKPIIMYHTPNAETLAAIEEARSDVEKEEMTDYDIEHFEEYVARL